MAEVRTRLSQSVDVTLPLDESVRMAPASWTVRSLRVSPDRLQELSHVGLCPHALTHLDLPGSYTAAPCLSAYQDLSPAQRLEAARRDSSEFQRPLTRRCVILNFLGRLWWMEQMLARAMAREELQGRLPARPVALWTEDEYASVLKELEIGVDEIRDMLGDLESVQLQDTVLVLYTGWRALTPLYRDCGHPHWWAHHPFLLYPFLSAEAVHWLVQQGIAGLATDAVSVDGPLQTWGMLAESDVPAPWECIRQAVARLRGGGERLDPTRMERWMPVHDCLLGTGRLIAESLELVSDVLTLSRSGGVRGAEVDEDGVRLPRAARACMTVLPFACGFGPDSLLAYILILPEHDE